LLCRVITTARLAQRRGLRGLTTDSHGYHFTAPDDRRLALSAQRKKETVLYVVPAAKAVVLVIKPTRLHFPIGRLTAQLPLTQAAQSEHAAD
jgi:hypothetical protein